MTTASMVLSYSAESTESVTSGSGRGDIWLTLEQEYKTELERNANLQDLDQMLALVKQGRSAFEYIAGNCSYATKLGTKVIVRLDFYVWPSSLELEYNLTSGMGTISKGIITEKPVEFDVVFNGSSYEELPYIFSGTFIAQMPLIRPDGTKVPAIAPVNDLSLALPNIMGLLVRDSELLLSEPIYTVFRAKGRAKGYKHTITFELDKPWESSFSDESLTIPVSNPTYEVSLYTTAGISYDYNDYPISLSSNSIAQSWSIEFINSEVFNLKNEAGVSVQSGNVNEDFVCTYFTLQAAGWYNTPPEAGDYFRFTVTEIPGFIDRTGYKIENIKDTIIASWMGPVTTDSETLETDSEIQTTSLALEIPQCVKDLLETCPGSDGSDLKYGSYMTTDDADENKPSERFMVYYNTCNGTVLEARWEKS